MRRAAFVLVLVLVGAACSSGGGGASPDDQPSAGSVDEGTAGLTLTSTAFVDGGTIPDLYAPPPVGDDTSPPLEWGGVPDGAPQLAVTVVDPDAGGFVHWIMAGLDPTSGGLGEGEVPTGAIQATNDAGEVGWFGPAPPTGESHNYVFTLHVLGTDPVITEGMAAAEALAAVEAATTSQATLTGTFTAVE